MTQPFGYIGIDFGTSNSHFAYCNHASKPTPEPVGVGNKGSMPTCVLWEKPAEEEKHIHSHGVYAEDAWVGMRDEKRSRMHFAFGFKPDLVHSERARRDAWAFLLRAFADIGQAKLPRPIGPAGYSVVIGVPAEIGEDHQGLTAEVAARAGFGEVECVEEPLGALAYHLHKGDLSPAEAREGVMVIDFGGGTFDVALVNTQGLQEPWGDPTLGGRLFDDLFLQWVLDQNSGLQVSEQETLVVWQRECRARKEEFSRHWAQAQKQQKPLGDFERPVEVGGRRVWLTNPTVEEFERRAREYRPSNVVNKYLRGLDRIPNGLILNQPIDLFERIRQVLSRGQSPGQLRGKFTRVILTGGSCWWPFMVPLVTEVLGVTEGQIMMSQNPEATIGDGLALYYVLKLHNDGRRRHIHGHKPRAKIDFEKAVTARLDRYADEVSGALLNVLMPRVEKEYWDWYNNGGSLNQVEARVREICKNFEKNEAEAIVKKYWVPLNTDLVRLMRDHLAKFLEDNEIPKGASNYIPESITSIEDLQAGAGGTGGRVVTEVGDMAAIVAVIATIALLILAAVKVKVIGAVVLAAMHNPPLAAALGVAALIAAGLAGQSVKETVENAIKSHEFNWVTRRLLYVALSESTFRNKLAEGSAEAKVRLRDAIRKSTREIDEKVAVKLPKGQAPKKPIEKQALETFDRIIDVVVKDLSVLEQICPENT
jgi:molecular chaperone DnaK